MNLTVAELKTLLRNADPKALVVLSSDPEGNTYRNLTGFDDTAHVGSETRWGDLEIVETATPKTKPAFILYP